jgi:PTS system mannose-specific IIC component
VTPAELIPLAVLGAVLGLDVVSFPQAMVSRPLVAATLAGAVAGDAERGLLIGAVLEMIALGTLPFGAARYPEWGSASVVGGALFAHAELAPAGQVAVIAPAGHLTLAVLATLFAASLSGQSMVWVRQWNGRQARRARPALERGDPAAVRAVQVRGLAADWLRAGLVTAISLAVLLPAYDAVAPLWEGTGVTERAALAGMTAALGSATTWMLVRGARGARRLLAAGIAASALLILL